MEANTRLSNGCWTIRRVLTQKYSLVFSQSAGSFLKLKAEIVLVEKGSFQIGINQWQYCVSASIYCMSSVYQGLFFFLPYISTQNLKFPSWNLNCSCWKQSTSVTRLHCISEGNGRPYRKRNRSRDSGLGWVEIINRVSPVGLIVKMTFVEVVEVLRNCYIFFVLPYCMRQNLQ